MKPRVLFVSNLFPTASEPYRGLDNVTLLHEMAGDFEIRVLSPRPTLPWVHERFAPRPDDMDLQPRWIPTAYLPKLGGPVNHLLMAASLRQAFEQTARVFEPQIVLGSWIYPDSCAALHLTHGRIPLVAIAQGTDVHQYLGMPARRRTILKYLPHAAAVITRSRELSRILAEAGFPREKLHAVYNGVSLETFAPREQAAARRECGLPAGGGIVLFVGNFYAVKNPEILVRAVARVGAGAPVLVMVGGGPLERRCRELAASLGISERVIFAGRKSATEIARLMNAADLLALPSQNEGVPNVVLEAFASGLPVVASRVGGIPEVLAEGALGRLCAAGDLEGLAAAIEGQLASVRDPASIRKHGEGFSWEKAASAYREILMKALE